MKKNLFILTMLLCIAVIPEAFAYNFQSGGIYYNITGVSPNTVAVTYATGSYNSYSGTVDIPGTVTYNGTTYTVTAIGNSAFRSCSNLTGVTIPNTVTSIGEYAFYNCSDLHAVDFPNALTSIGELAFYGSGLLSVIIPNSVETIGRYAFEYSNGLTTVSIGHSVSSIGELAFYCTGLTTVYFNADSCTNIGGGGTPFYQGFTKLYIGSNVKVIPDNAFRQCYIDTLNFPSSVSRIGKYAFYFCGLRSIHLNEGLAIIDHLAFCGTALSSVSIPSTVSSIAPGAFARCSSISSLTVDNNNETYDSRNNCNAIIQSNNNKIVVGCKNTVFPSTVTGIEKWAFSGCSGLTGELIIPDQITNIGETAFEGCSGITSLTIGKSMDSIGNGAFIYCSSLSSLFFNADSCVYMGDEYYNDCNVFNQSGLSNLIIGNNVKSIPANAFSGCTSLSGMLSIPNSIRTIGARAFKGCSALIGQIFLPDSLTYVGENAFNGCSGLSGTITIPKKVVYLGSGAFSFASTVIFNADSCVTAGHYDSYYQSFSSAFGNLTSLQIGDNVKNIPPYTFGNKTGLTGTLIIPDSVINIGERAFIGCNNIDTLIIGNSVSSIGQYAFNGCTGLTGTLSIPQADTIGYRAFYNCNGINSLILGEGVKYIGGESFCNCSSLTGLLNIPNSVTNIGRNAFNGCSGVDSLIIGEGVVSIGADAFKNCSSLISVVFNADSCISVGQYTYDRVFNGCTSLSVLTIGKHVKNIPGLLFKGCSSLSTVYYNADSCTNASNAFSGTSLTSLSIGENVKHIPSGIFSGCSSLTGTLTIPDSVIVIGDYAFYGCTGLDTLDFGRSVASIGNSAFYNCTGLVGKLNIPNSVTEIGNSAFSACSGLDTLIIGKSVQTIGYQAFQNCTGLIHVAFNADSCITMTGSVSSYYSDRRALKGCTNISSLTIGENVKNIPAYAFSDLNQITGTLIIPDSVVAIRTSAFSSCSGLTSLSLGRSVDSIGSAAFSGCTGLSSITSYNVTTPVLELTSTHPFSNISRNIPIYVPCSSAQAYRNAWPYSTNNTASYFYNIYQTLNPYIFTAASEDTLKGSVQVTTLPTCTGPAVIEATPNFFYVFDHWSDGNTDNPRTIEVTQDTNLVAYFREYNLNINYDTTRGHIVFLQMPTAENPQALIEVVPDNCYLFVSWSDYSQSGWYVGGTYDNPRTVQLTQDTTIAVNFNYAHPMPLTGSTRLCEGDSTVLKGVIYKDHYYSEIMPSEYFWVRQIPNGPDSYTNDTIGFADSIIVSTFGTYLVTGTDSSGCVVQSQRSVVVHSYPTMVISGETDICEGDSTTITAGLYEFTEDFTNGIPTNWAITGNTLEIYNLYSGWGNAGNAILFPAYNLPENTVAELTLPNINLKQFDIPHLRFKKAYAGKKSCYYDYDHYEYNGYYYDYLWVCDTILNEELKVMLSTDEGISWTEIWNSGSYWNALTESAYYPTYTYYDPYSSNSHPSIDLSMFSDYENVKIKFVFTGGQGNNMWFDDVQVYSSGCQGTWFWSNDVSGASQIFDSTGTWGVTFANYIGSEYCFSTDSVTITVWQPSDTTEITVNTPENYYVMNGETFCTSGDYTLNLQNVHGCDSVVILHLTVTPHFTVVNDTVFGRRFVSDNGSRQQIDGRRYSYQYKMTPDNYAQWADSVLTMWTEWYDSTSIALSYDSATNMASWSYVYVYDYRKEPGSVVSQKTIYLAASYIDSVSYEVSDTLTFSSSFGCDSSVIWKTQIYFKDIVELHDLEECNYVWQGDSIYYLDYRYSSDRVVMGFAAGDTLTESGKYRQKLTNVSGCDSTVYWYLTIHPTVYEDITVNACDSYTHNGVTYTESGEYIQNADTLLTIDRKIFSPSGGWCYLDRYGVLISIHPNGWSSLQYDHTEIDDETGGYLYYYKFTDQYGVEHPYIMGDTILYTDTVPGCSVTTLHLTINPSVTELVEATACDFYTWNDSTYTTSGEYIQTFTAANGCDSTVTLQLTINESKHTDTTAESCGSYTWNETTYTTSGEYFQTFTAANGCDSTVTLHLTILPLPTPNITGVTTVCEGQTATLNATGGVSYLWEDGTTTNTYPATVSGFYTVTVTNAEGCSATASTTVTVNPLPEVVITGSTTICPGGSTVLTATGADSYMWSNGSSNPSIPVNMFGQYSVIGTSAAGCFSTASVTVLVSQPPVITISGNTDICAGESTTLTANGGVSYMWSNGSTADTLVATTAGNWQVIGYNADGCSNMASVTVNLWQPASSNLYITSFDSCYLWFGTPRCESGDYTHTLQTIHGCDSVIILHLTLEDAITTEFSATSCDSYTWNGITYSQSGNYTQNFTAVNGNDSIVTLHLTINYSVSEVVEVTACDSYEWNGQTYTSSGNYTQTFIAANECDSVVTLNLTVNPSVSEVVEATACDSYLWNDSNYTVSGDYIQIFTAANGCDSVATLHLTINHPVAEFVETTVCDSYEWNGQSYVTSGDYTQTFTAANGCDSVVTLHLIVNDTKHVEFADSTCTTYTWNGQSYAQSGDYTQNFTAANGCDSVVTLHLTIVPTITPVIAVNGSLTACGNGSATLTVPGNYSNFVWSTGAVSSALTVNEAGYYWVTATDVYGCEGVSEMVQLGGSVQIDETPAICMVGVDNDHNLVVWEPLTDPDVSEYRIYREDGQANIFEPLAVIPASNSNAYVDATADPSVRAYRYKITAADTCGGETPMSAFHKTVHLTINQGLGNSYNLIWTPYEGFEFSSYKLYRGTANNNLQLIQTMPSTLTSYTDNNPAGDALFYQIEVVMTESCVQQTRDITYTGARSNIVYNGVAVTTEVTIEACDSYDWNGQILTSSGDYTQNFVSELGYDSVVTLHLTINPSVTEVIEVTTPDSCYTWNGQDYCTSGTYTQTLQTVHGCDSVVTMHLTITVGVNDYDGFDFKVYPNPTTGVVNVQITNPNSPVTAEFHVYDAYGKLIRVVDVQTAQIDLSHYAAGVYFIKAVADGNVVAVRKVVKQ